MSHNFEKGKLHNFETKKIEFTTEQIKKIEDIITYILDNTNFEEHFVREHIQQMFHTSVQ